VSIATRVFPLIAAACLLGCGDDSSSNPVSDAGNNPEVAADGANPLDTTDVTDVEVVEEPALILGVNEVLQKHPSAFTPLEDGDHLEIELGGFNGLWMMVIAFKTRGYFPGRVIVFADVSVDGQEISSLSLSKQSLEPGDDGWDYYYDLFLIANDTSVGGKEAVVDLTVRDYEGKEFEVSIQKKLLVVGGDPPYWP
jgi:hypothetical protein